MYDLLKMFRYAKLMKEIVTNKRATDYETIEIPHYCSWIMTEMSIKKKDPMTFIIPCNIGMLQLAKSLWILEQVST